MNSTGPDTNQFALLCIKTMLDFEFGIIRTTAIVKSLVTYVALDAFYSDNNSPGAMIMRRRTLARYPVNQYYGQ